MTKFIMAIVFLTANFIYQYFNSSPDYSIALERAYFQAVAMLFIVWYPKLFKYKDGE